MQQLIAVRERRARRGAAIAGATAQSILVGRATKSVNGSSAVYPGPISSQTVFCTRNQTASYCLTTLDRILNDYQVSCSAGTPTVTQCSGGCGVSGEEQVAACN